MALIKRFSKKYRGVIHLNYASYKAAKDKYEKEQKRKKPEPSPSPKKEKKKRPKKTEPTPTAPTPTKPTVSPEVIKLGDEEPKVGRQEDDSILLNLPQPEKKPDYVKSALLGAGIGAVAGAGIFAAGYAGAAIVASAATKKAITSGFAQQAAATGASYTATAARTATPVVSKVGQMAINLKTTGLTKSFLSKIFSVKAMALGGAWASSIFLGRWGQAEAPESIMIPIRDLIKIAKTPEDWAYINEQLQLAAEISDTSTWEEIILWSPFSAITGIMNKVEGVAAGIKILTETAAQVQEIQMKEQETGESEFQRERRESDEAAQERKREFEEEEKARDLEEMRWKAEYYALIREGKFEEADELLEAQG